MRLQPIVQQNVVTYATVIDVPNPELKLKPGMTANVNIEIARRTDVLRVPNAALRFRPTNEMYAALGQTPPDPRQDAATGRWRRARPRQCAPSDRRPPAPSAAASTGEPAAPARAPRDGSGRDRPVGPRPHRGGRSARSLGRRRGRGAGEGGTAAADRGGRREPTTAQLQSLSPEERAQMLATDADARRPARPRPARGSDPAPAEAAVERRGDRPARGREAAAADARASHCRLATRGATTIDALFGPLPTVESAGRVWLYVDKQLKPVRVRLGITDGQATELIEGDASRKAIELVTNVTTGTETTRPAATGGFPFWASRADSAAWRLPGGGGGNRGGGGGR